VSSRLPPSVPLLISILFGCGASAPAPTVAPAPATPPAPADSSAPAADNATDDRPPVAAVEPVTETLHGVVVTDRYRWMETDTARLEPYLDGQDAYARRTLAAIPGRDALLGAVHAANLGRPRVDVEAVRGDARHPRVFLTKRGVAEEVAQLWVRDGWDGEDRLLVDPRTRDHDGIHHSLEFTVPSPSGALVAYGIAASGSEDTVVEVVEVATGRVLPDRIDRAQYAFVSWRDDGSFFHWRRAKPAPGATAVDWFKNSAGYLHVLGDDPELARPLIGPMLPALGLSVETFSWVTSTPTSKWLLGQATPGTSADLQVFVAPAARLVPGKVPWRRITGPEDHVTGAFTRGNQVFLLSYADATRYRILVVDAAKGTLATARVFVPETDAVIKGMSPARDGLYVTYLDAGVSRIVRVSWDGTKRVEVPVPPGSTAGIATEPDRDGGVVTHQSWARALTTGYFDGKALRDVGLLAPWPVDYSHVVAEEVEVTSADGTRVPLSIVHRADAIRDGSAPALLTGYASYGSTISPFFWPISLAWVDRGGVFAVCHGRGGGERGKAWHEAGRKRHKARGDESFVASAEHRVASGYTSRSHLAVSGTSAGGVLVGGAITRAPDLFRVAFLRVPMVNLLRAELTEGGPANVPEYGTVTSAEDLPSMLASDPYHRVTDGKAYPAVLLTTGRHDVRVPSWQPAKMAARLQAATSSARPVLLRVERDGGHGIGSSTTQLEEEWADLFAFALWQMDLAPAAAR